jgi:hypothetical protein
VTTCRCGVSSWGDENVLEHWHCLLGTVNALTVTCRIVYFTSTKNRHTNFATPNLLGGYSQDKILNVIKTSHL